MGSPSRLGLSRWLVRLYPRAWRERYGDEFVALLADQPLTIASVGNILFAACREQLVAAFRASSAEQFRTVRRVSFSVAQPVLTCAAITVFYGWTGLWFTGTETAILKLHTWSPRFCAAFALDALGVVVATYTLGSAVLWVRKLRRPFGYEFGSFWMSLTVIFLVGFIADHPPDVAVLLPVRFVNHAVGSSNMGWFMTAMSSVPAALWPGTSARPSRPDMLPR